MPENDFGFFFSGRLKLISIFFTSLIAGFQIVLIFMIGKSRISRFNELANPIELLNLIRRGESDKLEFKSTIRLNMHTQKMGKEIELAWLKSVVAFCNTEGVSILIGVNGQGEILGTEADRFPNEDKALLNVQNLIKQHVGMEYAQYINYIFREVEGKKILVIQCQFCKEPVFLSNGDREQFFVRSGPASIELPVSKVLQFIKDKKR